MAHGRIRVLVVAVGVMVPALMTSGPGAASEIAQETRFAIPVESPRVGHNFRVSRSRADEGESALVYNATDNEYLAVWTDGRREETRGTDIFGQRLTPNGARIGRAFRISGWAASNDQIQPAVAYNSVDNEYLVVWADFRNQATRGWEIYAQRVSAHGERLGHNVRVSGARAVDDEWRPAVAHGSADNVYVVFWMDSRRQSTSLEDVFGQLIDAGGERLGHNFRITSSAHGDRPGHDHFIPVGGPAVAYNSTRNEFLVAWQDRRERPTTGDEVIYGQRVAAAGELLDDAFRISGPDTSEDRWPAIAHDPTRDQYMVVWNSDIWGDFAYVFGQRVTGDGERDENSFVITDRGFHTRSPSLAHDFTNDQYLVVWQDDRYRVSRNRTRAYGIFGQFITLSGVTRGDNFHIAGIASRNGWEPAVASNPISNQYLTVWTDWRNRDTRGADIYGQLMTAR